MRRTLAYWLAALIVAIVALRLFVGDAERGSGAAARDEAGAARVDAATAGSAGTTASGGATRRAGDEPGAGDRADAVDDAGPDAASSGVEGRIVAIPIPPEFEEDFERDEAFREFHGRLEAEARDPFWAARVEEFLTSHFDESLDPALYRIYSIECRSSACEILAVGYGDDALRGWMSSVADMIGSLGSDEQAEAFFGGPGNLGCGASDFAPGVVALNCTFQRTEPALADAGPAESFSLDEPYPAGSVVEPVEVDESVAAAIESSRELYDLHRRLEAEPTDFGWAGYIEPLIAEYVSGSDAGLGIGLVDVTCRTTLCEVQMVANDEDAVIRWIPEVFDFSRLEWHDLTTAGIDSSDPSEGEASGLVWFLERKPPGD